jgi:hypothetical protein
MLPTAQDEIGITGASVDPEPDNTGVFQPVDNLHDAALPNQGDDMGGTVADRRLIIVHFSRLDEKNGQSHTISGS